MQSLPFYPQNILDAIIHRNLAEFDLACDSIEMISKPSVVLLYWNQENDDIGGWSLVKDANNQSIVLTIDILTLTLFIASQNAVFMPFVDHLLLRGVCLPTPYPYDIAAGLNGCTWTCNFIETVKHFLNAIMNPSNTQVLSERQVAIAIQLQDLRTTILRPELCDIIQSFLIPS